MPTRNRAARRVLGLLCTLSVLPAWAQPATDPAASNGNGNGRQTALPAKRLVLPKREAFQVGGHLDAEAVSDLAGGRRRGTVYDSVLHVGAAVNTGPLGWWQGGRLYVSGVHIESGLPSQNLVGDLQGVSNLAAPHATRIYQFWYRQQLPWWDLKLRAGLIDLNQYFVIAGYAGVLLNSSFGVVPTISANVGTSIYPEPGVGAMVSGRTGDWGARLGVFQGHPDDRGTALHRGEMVIGELGYRRLKLGLWHYQQPAAPVTDGPAHDWGAYGIAEQELYHGSGRELGGFLQLGGSPQQLNPVPYYLGGGLVLKGPFHGRPRDRLALGLARAWVRGTGVAPETSYELTYLYRLGERVYLQPDLQYVTNPGGTGEFPDALVGFLRLHLEFY